MRYALYGMFGLMLALAALVSAGTSAQAAAGAPNISLSENSLIVKIHDGEHHDVKKAVVPHKGVCKHKRKPRGHCRRGHKRGHTCHHDDD